MPITLHISILLIVVNTALGMEICYANPERLQNRLLYRCCNTPILWSLEVIVTRRSTANYETPDLDCILDYAASIPQLMDGFISMINYHGTGTANSSLLMRKI